MEAMVLQGRFGGGDPVVLEYGDALMGSSPDMFQSAKDKGGKDCAIM